MLDQSSRRAPLALAFATIERPHVAQRLVLSARRYFPRMPIHVADQSFSVSAMQHFYAHMDVKWIRMPFDAGVCASRNRLVEAISEDYLVLCDDDFVFGPETDFSDAIRILERRPDIGVVGGRLYDYDGKVEYSRHWELFLYLDAQTRTLSSIPMYHFAPRVERVDDVQFYLCDAVMNFAVMRRALFDDPRIRWDERFKSNGEHEDFYLNLKLNSILKVVYLPTMVAYHHHPTEFVRYRSQLRDRSEGWRRLFAKWGIDQHLEIGLGVRSIDDLGSTVADGEASKRFFLNDNLSLRRAQHDELLQIDDTTSLRIASRLDQHGIRRNPAEQMARLSITPGGGIGVAPATPPENEVAVTAAARHGFVPPDLPSDTAPPEGVMLIRYCPIARGDADFILWCRMTMSGSSVSPRTVPLHVRWFDDQGRVLMWASNRNLMDLRRSDYWVPLLVDVPLFPKDSDYLRFEAVAGEHGGRRRIGVGFVFQPGPASDQASFQALDPDVLALLPGPPTPGDPGSTPGGGDYGYDARLPIWAPCEAAPGLVLLAVPDGPGADLLLLSDWAGLGCPLAHIYGSTGADSDSTRDLPTHVAIPQSALTEIRFKNSPPQLRQRS